MSQPEDRWASLAEELGLAEPAVPPPAPPPAPPPTKFKPTVSVTAPAGISEEKETRAAPEPSVASTPAPGEFPPPVPASETTAESPSADQMDRTRRRRRRRGRRPETSESGVAGAEPETGAAVSEPEPISTEAGEAVEAIEEVSAGRRPAESEEQRRGRRRRRRRDERGAERGPERVSAAAPEIADEEQASGTPVEEEDNEPVDDLSDLDVPPWNELIAGLYRPPDR